MQREFNWRFFAGLGAAPKKPSVEGCGAPRHSPQPMIIELTLLQLSSSSKLLFKLTVSLNGVLSSQHDDFVRSPKPTQILPFLSMAASSES
jgi:hypothetical protein